MPESGLLSRLEALELFPQEGRVCAIGPSEVEALGPDLPIGAHCSLVSAQSGEFLAAARVVAVANDRVKLVPFGSLAKLRLGDIVRPALGGGDVMVGDDFSGRALDALGRPLDGKAAPASLKFDQQNAATLDRIAPTKPLVTGIRAIDGLLTIGVGARIGIFAASGVGKTRLIEQILRQVKAQRIVICLVGERGREVEALWTSILASSIKDYTTLVAATSDESALMRVQAVEQALSLAEHWRSKGEEVLFLVDSATRLAMALREVGLIAGEPPTVRAYTPSVFRELPRLVERCGAVRSAGAITAIFTVLSESDDVDDPIVEVMKSLLDGHIVLSRRLSQIGHFPAIDIGRSISRLFDGLVDGNQRRSAVHCRAMLARHEEARILIESGMYKAGGDHDLDQAVEAQAAINAFLRQGEDELEAWSSTAGKLAKLGSVRT